MERNINPGLVELVRGGSVIKGAIPSTELVENSPADLVKGIDTY